jgi:DNA-binding transcriptional MocR family regulator
VGTDLFLERTHIKFYRYETLAEELHKQIKNQRWLTGERLPSIRDLSKQYTVAKNTVIQALHLLESAGTIESRPKSGFFVALQAVRKAPLQPEISSFAPKPVNVPEIFQDIMTRSAAFDILPSKFEGTPPQSLVTLQRHINKGMRHQALKKAMYYDEPKGAEIFRKAIKDWYRASDVNLTEDDFCITSGCQNSLFLALMATCKPGDNVAVECPCFYGVLQLLQQLHLNVIEVPSSPDTGLDIAMFEAALTSSKIKAVVVTPAFSTPCGATIPEGSRRQIVELANQYDIAIIEDDIYGDLGFIERPVPLKAFDTQQRVILCSSFSKSLSRDLRVGWVAGGRWHDQIVKLKLVTSLASNQAIQIGLANFILKGELKRHLYQKRQTLKLHRDQLIMSIQKYLADNVCFVVPNGGLCLWVELGPEVNTQTLYHRLLLQNIVITPGALFSVTDRFNSCLRLSFSHPTVGARDNAIKTLGAVLRS